MSRFPRVFLVVSSLVLISAASAWPQANVDESLETATLYVDASKGSDSNPGTQDKPLKTIGAAASLASTNNKSSIGTKVIINPGTYREAITIGTGHNTTDLPITFEAATTGKAVISGADIWTGWKTYSGNSKIYTNSWPYQWGLCALDNGSTILEQDIIRRQEMVIVNGTVMTQVLSLTDTMPGTFYVDVNGGTIYLYPPSTTNMSTARVEVATRSTLFSITNNSNIVLRGLTFQYSNACRNNSAVEIVGTNILVDTDTFRWNNARGLDLSAGNTYTTVQYSTANHNGQEGMHGVKMKYALFQNDETSYNGWRSAQGGYYGWEVGGLRSYKGHDDTFNSITANYNQTWGLHWDTDHARISIDSNVATQNLLSAAFFEVSQGPITITNSSFCNSGLLGVTGLNALGLRNTENVTVTGSNLVNGGSNQIGINGAAGGLTVTDWETGQTYTVVTQNLTLMSNLIKGMDTQNVFNDPNLGGSDWTDFQSTFISDYNTWWNATTSNDFITPLAKPDNKLAFADWQSTMGQDAHSTWKAPSGDPAACTAVPDKSDYWFVTGVDTQTVTHGNSTTFTVSAIPLKFTGTITLSADGVQSIPGASGSWSSNSISGGSGTVTYTVTTGTTTPKGTYPIVLIANSKDLTRTLTVSVIVN